MFELPVEVTLATATAYVGEAIGGLWIFIALAIGIPLAFYVIRKVISLIPGR